jgi:hypothetical protein
MIKFDEEYKYVTGTNIQDIAIYKNRYIYFAIDYKGVFILDTKTKKTQAIKNLFPKKIVYSELAKSNIDITDSTDILQMVFYKDNLIFSESSSRNEENVYVYNLTSKKITCTYKGKKGDMISELFVDNNRLIGLGYYGILYEWDLSIINSIEYLKSEIKL